MIIMCLITLCLVKQKQKNHNYVTKGMWIRLTDGCNEKQSMHVYVEGKYKRRAHVKSPYFYYEVVTKKLLQGKRLSKNELALGSCFSAIAHDQFSSP